MIWRVLNENDKYEVSNTGLVRRRDSQRVLSGCITHGYHTVKLTFDNSKQRRYRTHRLVAEHFIENPDPKNKAFVNHIDGNKLNNCVENLEWVTLRENNLHYYQKIRQANKEKKHFEKPIPVIQYDLEHNKIAEYPSMSQAHKATGIPVVQIARCVHGEMRQANGFIWEEGSTTTRE